MSLTGLAVFDTTVQEAHSWLTAVMNELGWEPHPAYLALRTVLHALRDQLPTEAAVQLGAHLPTLIRGFYYEGWQGGSPVGRAGHREEFLVHIRQAFTDRKDIPPRVAILAQQTRSVALREARVEPQAVARAVLKVLAHRLPAGELEALKRRVPAELRELWPP